MVTDDEKDFAGLNLIDPMRMAKRGGIEETGTT
jgi:hypothetical protein